MKGQIVQRFWRDVRTLTKKEFRQILRDPSVLMLGIMMPLILIVLFGQGLTFDVKDIRLVIADSVSTAQTRALDQAFLHNPTFETTIVHSRQEAKKSLDSFRSEAALIFEKGPQNVHAQLLIDGIEASRSTAIREACTSVIRSRVQSTDIAYHIEVVPRLWYNETADSRWFLVPGLFELIFTMTGTILTCLVIAREWERGTMEALFSTPISTGALIVSKLIPYFILSIGGGALCLLAAIYWYGLPIRGSLLLIILSSALYIWISLAVGLTISAKTRSQFLSCQVAVMVSFIPALLLSGFIFDLRCMPKAIAWFAECLPTVHYLELMKTGFFSGGVLEASKSLLVLSAYAIFFYIVLKGLLRKEIRR